MVWKTKSICHIVVNNIQWWPDCSIEEKMDMWQRVLAANLKPMMTEYKNKIHQPMRHAFNGQYFIFYLFFLLSIIFCLTNNHRWSGVKCIALSTIKITSINRMRLGCKSRRNSGRNSGSSGSSRHFQRNLKTRTITFRHYLLAIAKHE